MKASFSLSPLAAWLLLAGAVTTLFPLTLEQTLIILIITAALSIVWLPGKRLRSAPFVVLYAATALLALIIPVPLPAVWHPLAKLLVTLCLWGLVLALPLAGLLAYLFRTREPNRSRQD